MFDEQALPEDYLPADLSQVKMDELFEHIDADSDGRISYQEFKEALSLQDAIMTHFKPDVHWDVGTRLWWIEVNKKLWIWMWIVR